jgi:type IV pilus biogenesis protein CpaD/CtpE
MNCLDFQRVLNADPRRLSAAACAHAEGCPECERRRIRQINEEAQWEDALRVALPDGLEDRIVLAAKMAKRQRQRIYALAASLAAGVAIALGVMMPHLAESPDLALIAVEHVMDEPQHLTEDSIVDPGKLDSLLAHVGAQSRGALPVTYAGTCRLPNGEGGHIVLDTPHGRVTLMLIPNSRTAAMQRRTHEGMLVEVYAARRGSYSLVAPNEAALTEAKTILARQLRWV